MVNINKKGYMKTVEAIIALMILFGVVLFSISKEQNKNEVPADISAIQDTILNWAQYDNRFREAIFDGKLTAITYFATNYLAMPPGVKLYFDVGVPSQFSHIPTDKNVYVDSVILIKNGVAKTFTVYLWKVDPKVCTTISLPGVPCVSTNDCVVSLPLIFSMTIEEITNEFALGCDGNCTITPHVC